MAVSSLFSFGIGIGTQDSAGNWLDVYFSKPLLNPSNSLIEILSELLTYDSGSRVIELDDNQLSLLSSSILERCPDQANQASLAGSLVGAKQCAVAVFLASDAPPESVPEVYLKLQLISHRLVQPHGLDLTGIFGLLPNVAWTNQGPVALNELADRQLQSRCKDELLEIMSVDKFPKMVNYVVPDGIRIGDTDRVRLGAYLGAGTTIMHEGFVNFNAGTLGTSMIEGRISAGVVVGEGSDLGGGCSTMGTLSGGGNMIISLGEGCLIGANAGIGIPLGDRCTVEAGLYITAGTKLTLLDNQNQAVEVIKARELAGKSDLLFRRNSQSGAVECKANKSAIALNSELHANN